MAVVGGNHKMIVIGCWDQSQNAERFIAKHPPMMEAAPCRQLLRTTKWLNKRPINRKVKVEFLAEILPLARILPFLYHLASGPLFLLALRKWWLFSLQEFQLVWEACIKNCMDAKPQKNVKISFSPQCTRSLLVSTFEMFHNVMWQVIITSIW